MTKRINFKNIALVIFSMASANLAFGASAIKKLTSKSTAQDVSSRVELPSTGLNKHSVGVGLGQTFLQGHFRDNGEDKITPEIYYNYSASHSFDLMINFHASKHSYSRTFVKTTGLTAGIKAKAYQFDSFSPYAMGGLGFYSPKVKRIQDGKSVESRSKVVFGYHLGAGTELKLNKKFAFGIIGHYHNPFDVKQENAPEVEGSYFKLLMTVLYTF